MSQDNKYITLQGYPLHKPLLRVFHQSAVVKSCAASMTLAVGLDTLFLGGQHTMQTIMHAFSIAATMGVGVACLETYALKRIFESASEYAIDTKPDHNTPPTSASNLMKARQVAGFSFTGFIGMAAGNMAGGVVVATAAMFGQLQNKAYLVQSLSEVYSFIFPIYFTLAANGVRFANVAMPLENGFRHVIIDRPPAEQTETENNSKHALLPSMVAT